MRNTLTLLALIFLMFGAAMDAHAEQIVAITPNGQTLVSFDSATPGIITRTITITGLGTSSTINAIDFRASDGQLYGFDRSRNQIHRIDPVSGAATLVSTLNISTLDLSGDVGMDFNPVTGELRIAGFDASRQANRNLRVTIETGATVEEGILTFPPGDPNVGRVTGFVGLAYTNNVVGATTTSLYGLSPGVLSIIDDPSSGLLRTIGTALLPTSLRGFDISGATGIAYATAAISIEGQGSTPQLFTVDLSTGTVTLIGRIGVGISGAFSGAAVLPQQAEAIPEPATLVLLGTGLASLGWRRRRNRAQRNK